MFVGLLSTAAECGVRFLVFIMETVVFDKC